jgi:hypothetical protein
MATDQTRDRNQKRNQNQKRTQIKSGTKVKIPNPSPLILEPKIKIPYPSSLILGLSTLWGNKTGVRVKGGNGNRSAKQMQAQIPKSPIYKWPYIVNI